MDWIGALEAKAEAVSIGGVCAHKAGFETVEICLLLAFPFFDREIRIPEQTWWIDYVFYAIDPTQLVRLHNVGPRPSLMSAPASWSHARTHTHTHTRADKCGIIAQTNGDDLSTIVKCQKWKKGRAVGRVRGNGDGRGSIRPMSPRPRVNEPSSALPSVRSTPYSSRWTRD